ncbi:MAG: hypothetical protein JXQ65_10155 [Candidatus Marinimicrobia bacterium]|nr:hypothetical protein [Candidatus Neomarinimicrobiota bacterium]
MKKFIFIMAIAISNTLLGFDDFRIGPIISNAPWNCNINGQTITLGGSADKSPVPSKVSYYDENRKTLWTYGITVRDNVFIRSGETEFEKMAIAEFGGILELSDNLAYISGGIGGSFTHGLSDFFTVSLGGVPFLSYIFGYLGEVGDASGDYHLEAPDGEIYYSGSSINVSSLAIGMDFLVGFELIPVEEISFRVDYGYRLTSKIKNWNYNVKSEDMERQSELPAEGFSADPPSLKPSGKIIKFSILYNLDL